MTEIIQSPSLNLQAVGYNGKSGKGRLLRWFLTKQLNNYLPKGGIENGIAELDDYVTITRIPYDKISERRFIFGDSRVTADLPRKLWYLHDGHNEFYLRCISSEFDRVWMQGQSLPDFAGEYSNNDKNFYELELKGQSSFAVNFNIEGSGNFKARVEAFSYTYGVFPREEKLVARYTIEQSSTKSDLRIVAENIDFIRFTIDYCSAPNWGSIEFETYEGFFDRNREYINNIDPSDHQNLKKKFALSLDDVEVASRFDAGNDFKIDGHWQKFTDDAFVNLNNYINDPNSRWNKSEGIKDGVGNYLSLVDPKDSTTYSDTKDTIHPTSMDVSMGQALNLAASDFHVARMLGLGYIDAIPDDADQDVQNRQFIYLAEYKEQVTSEHIINHFYLSLPTSVNHIRKPLDVNLQLDYGLTVDNASDIPVNLTDGNGYTFDNEFRFVNLRASLANDYQENINFFDPLVEFQSSWFSIPIFIGIKNRKPTVDAPEPEWEKPELSNDDTYKDSHGIPETVPIIFNKKSSNPTYIHQISTMNPVEGSVNEYSAYSIDIFSRASDFSAPVRTDLTKYKKPNTLKPPTNVTAQLIQDENPLLLTSENEQNWLRAITNLPANVQGKLLCRLTFDYNYLQDQNYRYGDQIRIFHKKRLPLTIIGSIEKVIDNDEKTFKLETGSYRYSSTGELFTPEINPDDIDKFIGSVLAYDLQNYIVEKITLNGTFPQITVRKIENRIGTFIDYKPDDSPNDKYKIHQKFPPPKPDSSKRFTLVENLSRSENWAEKILENTTVDNKLLFLIQLRLTPADLQEKKWLDSKWGEITEKYIETDAPQKAEKYETSMGIQDNAEVISVQDSPGRYEIKFTNSILPHHPQYLDTPTIGSCVDWYRGIVRIHTAGDLNREYQRKTLRVELIEKIGTGEELKLIVFDENFLDPNAPNQPIGEENAKKNIQEGGEVSVNFYPGYRVYLREDATAYFDSQTVIPTGEEENRTSIIGLQTIDTSTGYSSAMSVPALIKARNIIHPQKPDKPKGPAFSNPPDFFNKANYSFTTKFEFNEQTKKKLPWGLVYFRIDSNQILASLYESETIEEIYNNLPPADEDPYLSERWANLLSFDFENNNEFTEFPASVPRTFYRFPNPNRKALAQDFFVDPITGEKKLKPGRIDFTGNEKPGLIIEKMKEAIFSNLLPLTEQPLIFKFIKGDNSGEESYVPQAKKQTIDDQAPMAKKIDIKRSPDDNRLIGCKVLFTDFTLDGNMNSDTLYFYLVRELGNTLAFGEPGEFSRPVRILNTRPPEKLTLQKFTVQVANNNAEPTVIFQVCTSPKSRGITKIQILRTNNVDDSHNPSGMDIVKEYKVKDLPIFDGKFEVKDDFSISKEIPFGDQLYYRLIGIKEVKYTDADGTQETIEVYSEPTAAIITTVIDSSVPKGLTITIDPLITTGNNIIKPHLYWNSTCYNGKYRLYWLVDNVWKALNNNPSKLDFEFKSDLAIRNESVDADNFGQIILYHFKVMVENTSGIINQESNIFTFHG